MNRMIDIILKNMKKVLRSLVEEAQRDEEYKKLYVSVRRVSLSKLKELVIHALFLKTELQKLRLLLLRVAPHMKLLVEDIRTDIQLFLHSFLTIMFHFDVIPTKEGRVITIFDLNKRVEKALKYFFDLSKSIEYIYQAHREFFSSKPKIVIHPKHLKIVSDLDENYDIILANTNEEKFLSSVFGVTPPYLMIDGTVIPIDIADPNAIDKIYEIVISQKKSLPLLPHLRYLSLKLINAVSSFNMKKIKKLIFELRSAISLTMEVLIKHYIHLSLKAPEFFAPYSFAMICLNKLYSAENLYEISFHYALQTALCCSDIIALADLYYRGYADIKDISPVAVVIFREGCNICEEVKKANESFLQQKKYKNVIEIKEIFVDDYDIEGASYYAVPIGLGKRKESTSIDVPALIFSSKVVDIGITIDPNTGEQTATDLAEELDSIIEELEQSLKINIFSKAEEKRRPSERRPLISTSVPRPSISPVGRMASPFSYASKKEIKALILRMVKDGYTASEISDTIFAKYRYSIKPEYIRVLVFRLTGKGMKALRNMSEEEFEKLLAKLFPDIVRGPSMKRKKLPFAER